MQQSNTTKNDVFFTGEEYANAYPDKVEVICQNSCLSDAYENIQIHREAVTNGKLRIHYVGYNNKILLSAKCLINRTCEVHFSNAPGPEATNNCSLCLGENSYINGNVSFLFGESETHIKIGKDCLLADGISFWTSDSHPIFCMESGKRINPPGNITIKDRVWICNDVRFLNHSYIEEGSIVGTRALVTRKHLEPNSLYAGVPAKMIRKGVRWQIPIA